MYFEVKIGKFHTLSIVLFKKILIKTIAHLNWV